MGQVKLVLFLCLRQLTRYRHNWKVKLIIWNNVSSDNFCWDILPPLDIRFDDAHSPRSEIELALQLTMRQAAIFHFDSRT